MEPWLGSAASWYRQAAGLLCDNQLCVVAWLAEANNTPEVRV